MCEVSRGKRRFLSTENGVRRETNEIFAFSDTKGQAQLKTHSCKTNRTTSTFVRNVIIISRTTISLGVCALFIVYSVGGWTRVFHWVEWQKRKKNVHLSRLIMSGRAIFTIKSPRANHYERKRERNEAKTRADKKIPRIWSEEKNCQRYWWRHAVTIFWINNAVSSQRAPSLIILCAFVFLWNKKWNKVPGKKKNRKKRNTCSL